MKRYIEASLNNALIFIVLIFTALSCQSNRDPLSFSPPVFKEQKSVNIVEIEIDKLQNIIFDLEIIGDNILARAFDGTNAVSIFDKNNGRLINSVAPIGRGPGEYLSPYLEIDISKDSVYILDPESKSVYNYTHKDLLDGSIPERIVKLEGYNFFINALPLTTGKFLSYPTKGARFSIHKADGKLISSYNKYPLLKEITDTISAFYMYRGREGTSVKPDGTKFVSTNSLGSILEIFSIKDDIITLEEEQRFYAPKINILKNKQVTGQPECLIGLWDLKTTDKYIYAIFSGKQIKEMTDGQISGKYVYVFDWDGKPVKSYNLNKDITRLAIDEISQRAYVVTKNQDSSEVFGYFGL